MTTNPYSAPAATVADPAAPTGRLVPGGRGVAAGHGWTWIAQGWDLFRQSPGVWVGMFLIFMLMYFAVGLIPFLGGVVTVIFAPVFTAGFMLGCRSLDEGGTLQVGHLFAGFRQRFGALVGVGAVYFAGTLIAVLITLALVGGSLAGFAQGTLPADGPLTGLLFVLVFLALLLPVAMAFWFAAPLVVLHERGPLEAMKESFSGCLKNIVPYLLYGVIMLVLGILASIPLLLGWLVLGPVLTASLYASYRDIYLEA